MPEILVLLMDDLVFDFTLISQKTKYLTIIDLNNKSLYNEKYISKEPLQIT
jgi:hypothetical protein